MAGNLTPSTRVVFDTNVLISTFVFPGFAANVYDHCALHFELYTSEWILSEFDKKWNISLDTCRTAKSYH